MNDSRSAETAPRGFVEKALNWIEVAGNKLPDPAVLFVIALVITWILSALLAPVEFTDTNPRTGEPLRIVNQLAPEELTTFMTDMVNTFVTFAPLGVVLVALLGVGVAEHSGYINAGLKQMLQFTPAKLLTPMLTLVAIVSHTAADAGYVLVIPLGGVIFYAAGRHPLAGIAAAFAGVSGGFSANFIPSGIDPLLANFTQIGANVLDPDYIVNPLCNLLFTGLSSILVILVVWFITDRIIEPRLRGTEVDGDPDEMPKMETLGAKEKRALTLSNLVVLVLFALLIVAALPDDSPLRNAETGSLTRSAPLMGMIVPLIFVFFLVPGVVYGYLSGTFSTHKDVIKGMSHAMETMGYYMVMAFCASLFTYAFGKSNLGALIAIKGAAGLEALALPGEVTLVGIIALSAIVNLLVGSASAKWALLAPIFVPILMGVGLSPELTQAAYRVGDSSTNIITPLMPYFPLIVVFCARYVKNTGIGTVVSLMLPYSVSLLILWTAFLVVYWLIGIPLGFEAGYVYPPTN
jgi:aminobenzoyl-glutamate transport protein